MSIESKDSEFYIGYFSDAPPETASFIRRNLILLFLVILFLGPLLGFLLEKMDRGSFEFGLERSYQGALFAEPIPILRTAERSYVLVGNGKFGASEWAQKWVKDLRGRHVVVRGTLINRDPIAMLEIDANSSPEILEASAAEPNLPTETLGQVELQGELVDSKCYLGVMRPAVGKVHRACAIRCLSGGVPPGLLLRKAEIDTSILILLGRSSGKPPLFSVKWAGRTVKAKGQLELRDGLPFLNPTEVSLVK